MFRKGEKLALARSAVRPKAWSQQDLAEVLEVLGALGRTAVQWKGRIGNYENLRTEIPDHVLEIFAGAIGVPLDWFKDGLPPAESPVPTPAPIQIARQTESIPSVERDPRQPLNTFPLIKIPVIGEVAAGRGATNVDPDDGGVWVPERLARPDWTGMKVVGDSMMPHLEDGDVVVFKQETQPRSRFTYLVEKDREYRLKQVRWKDDRWFLHSTNPAYEDEPFLGWRILAKVVGVYRLRGTREKLLVDTEGLRFDED